MSHFISMAELYPQVVDCRYLNMEMEFFLLDQQQLNSLAEFLLEQARALMGDAFFGDWSFDNRHVKLDDLYSKIRTSTKAIDYWFEGAVLGELVHNRRTFAQYKRFLQGPSPFEAFDWDKCDVSVDYPDAFSQFFAGASSNEDYKKALLGIFNAPKRKKLALWRYGYDISCGFFSSTHAHHEGLYYGSFDFSVAYTSVGAQGIQMLDKLVDIARQASQKYIHINARAMLTPYHHTETASGQYEYFYSFPKDYEPPYPEFSLLETRRFVFSPGAEWFNILSPLQSSHVPLLEENAKEYPQITVETLPGGGKAVSLKKTVDETDVADLAEVKELLYDALMPGMRIFSLKEVFRGNIKPRREWELVPILEEELDVYAGYIVFRHVFWED